MGEPIEQVANRRLRCRLAELGIIGGFEFFPARRVAVEEAAQSIARGNFLQPQVDPRPFPRQPARPQAIDQNTSAVPVVRGFVDSFCTKLMPCHFTGCAAAVEPGRVALERDYDVAAAGASATAASVVSRRKVKLSCR